MLKANKSGPDAVTTTATTASTTARPQDQRLKKDGTPDLRGGKIGNRGNRHATGRKKIEGQETRKNLLLYTSDSEFEVMQDFCHLLKQDIELAQKVLDGLGTPPAATKKPPARPRQKHGIRLLESEKVLAKQMLLLVRDRITACKLALKAVKQD